MKIYLCPTGIDLRSIFTMELIFFVSLGMKQKRTTFLLNTIHPALKLKKENNSILLFVDMLLCKTTTGFLTTLYRKRTFTGLNIHWDSFCPPNGRLMICSKSKLDDEIRFISSTFCYNSFPEGIVRSVILSYLPTPPLGQDMTQGRFLSGV